MNPYHFGLVSSLTKISISEMCNHTLQCLENNKAQKNSAHSAHPSLITSFHHMFLLPSRFPILLLHTTLKTFQLSLSSLSHLGRRAWRFLYPPGFIADVISLCVLRVWLFQSLDSRVFSFHSEPGYVQVFISPSVSLYSLSVMEGLLVAGIFPQDLHV